MKEHMAVLSTVALIYLGGNATVPETITFESAAATNYGPAGASFVDAGFRFTDVTGWMYVLMPEGCTPRCAYNETQRLLAYEDAQPMFEMTAESGGTFSLYGFDGGESFSTMPDKWATHIVVEGRRPTGKAMTEVFDLDGINDGMGPLTDYQSFTLHRKFTNVSSVRFYGLGGVDVSEFTIDNVIVKPSPPDRDSAPLILSDTGVVGLQTWWKRHG